MKRFFGDILTRYQREVSPRKRGARWESRRLDLLLKDPLAGVELAAINGTHVASWRDRRLQTVSAASVLREWNLLSAATNHARVEWGWVESNPFALVRRPAPPAHRERVITTSELAALEAAVRQHPERTLWPRVLGAVRWAIETGMRAGEVVGLTWDDLDLDARVARLDREIRVNGRTVYATKNGRRREVPLSAGAVGIARETATTLDGEVWGVKPVFGLTSGQLDSGWRSLCDAAGVKGCHFHDTRHTAITRLAKKLHVLELARMVGITDLKILGIYYNESAAEIAKKL